VAGCYYYSDSFDNYFLWPMDYVPIRVDRPFASFEKLKTAWNEFAERYMTSVVQGGMTVQTGKGPVVDTQFDADGITFIKPAPPMGLPSGFFVNGRPRLDSTGLTKCPPVAKVFPELTREEWGLFRELFADQSDLFSDYDAWQNERGRAVSMGEDLIPFVPVPVSRAVWEQWCDGKNVAKDVRSIFACATDLFAERVRPIIAAARERLPKAILPSRYVLAVTEEIGQDRANDLSHIVSVKEFPGAEPVERVLVTDLRIFHEHAIALAAAYALAEGTGHVLWNKNLEYAWV
jgi:hypothetical protein